MLLALVPINYLGYKFINRKLHEKSKVMQEETSSGYKELIAIFKNTDMIKQESDYKRIASMISPSIVHTALLSYHKNAIYDTT